MAWFIYAILYFSLLMGVFFVYTFYEQKNYRKTPVPTRPLSSIAIIVPAHNEEKTLARTIKSLLNLDYPKNKIQIVIVDDGSTDNTFRVAKEFEKFGVKAFSKPGGGKGSALNYGIKRTNSDLVTGLDADSFVRPDTLINMVGYFNDPQVWAVTPSMKVWKPKTLLQKMQEMEFLFGVFLRKVFAILNAIHVTPGPFTIYRRKLFEKHGYYDENNITEDIEIALRIQSLGYRIENSLQAEVLTKCPAKFMPLFKQRLRWYLGFIDNVTKYGKLIGMRHGLLGGVILPWAFLSIILGVFLVGKEIFKGAPSVINRINAISTLGYNPLSYVRDPSIDLFWALPTHVTIITTIVLCFTILMIIAARSAGKKGKPIYFSYVLYFFVYIIIYLFWWVATAFYKLFGTRIAFGNVVWRNSLINKIRSPN